jgi:hypothetical protein
MAVAIMSAIACAAMLIPSFYIKERDYLDAEPSNTPYPTEKQRALAMRFFSEGERTLLDNGELDFSALWTRREACLKMTGEGFAAGIKRELADGVHLRTLSILGYTVSICTEKDVRIEHNI